jgi:hypothetical protein
MNNGEHKKKKKKKDICLAETSISIVGEGETVVLIFA